MTSRADETRARLASVRERLRRHADDGPPPGLTQPDPGGSERWEAGQVWAHLAEFPAYWMGQVRHIVGRVATGDPQPIPFGRTKADPGRIAAIERDRNLDPHALLARVTKDLAEAMAELQRMSEADWRLLGLHPTRGPMAIEEIVQRFLVDHLEEHADQLDELRQAAESAATDADA
jgi:hypothetical protein